MRSLKSGLFAFMLTGLLGAAAVVGCSASGDGAAVDDTTPTPDPTPGATSTLPPKGTDPTPPVTDAGTTHKDASPKPEAGVDAGPPPPVAGTACPTLNAIATEPCGACGKASTVCLDDGTGKGKWSAYGACENELAGGCVPKSVVNEACGNCGTQVKTCTQYCAYTISACTGQPVNSCVPGNVEYISAGCAATPNTYLHHTCGAACTYGSYTSTCEAPVNANKMTASATVGAVVTHAWTLAAAAVGKKVSGTCGASASASSTATYPFVAVEVTNPNPTLAATIQVYHSGTGTPLDTLIWIYKKTIQPMNDIALAACDFGSADSCITGDPCGNVAAGGSTLDWAGVDNVTIPAGGKILVYSAGYTSTELGNFNLNLKTVKFGP